MESNRFVKLYKQGSTLGSSYLEIWVDRDGKPLLASAEEMEQPCKKS